LTTIKPSGLQICSGVFAGIRIHAADTLKELEEDVSHW